MKNLLLSADCSVTDAVICPPPTTRPADLGDLLSTVAERLDSYGVLMLSGPWAQYVTDLSMSGGDQAPAPVHSGDWSARVVAGDTWICWKNQDGHAVWTVELDAIEPGGKDSPLIDENPMVTALNFNTWAETTGTPWIGTPGMTGNGLLIDSWDALHPKAPAPRWHGSGIYHPSGKPWPFGHIEQAYTPSQWHRETDQRTHGYDLNKAYLSAYQVAELPADQLQHSMKQQFDPRLGGIWRVSLSTWRYHDLLPDPAGYALPADDGTRWLTTPTLTLLQQLTDRGDYDGFAVHESYTAPARRITRKWAELLRDVADAARAPLNVAAKQVYKQTYGMWTRGGRVSRPEWHYTIISTARANLWRKIDLGLRTHRHGPDLTLQWADSRADQAPVRVETDAVYYVAADTDQADRWADAGAARGFRLDPSGMKLGHFKPTATAEPGR